MNFIETFKKGQLGQNLGLSTGIKEVDDTIYGVHQGKIYGIFAPPKTGKTAYVDFSFVIHPILYALENNIPIEYIYYSFEISRVVKEFIYASFFFKHDFNESKFEHKGKMYKISSAYLLGHLKDDDNELITVSESHKEILRQIYTNRIIPLFGEYNSKNEKIKKGIIQFIEDRINPTGILNYLKKHAEDDGEFIRESYDTKENGSIITKQRVTGYVPKDSKKYTVIVIDHIRKLSSERGFSIKENMDKMSDYQVSLRNTCNYTFVNVVHSNRNLDDIQRVKFNTEFLAPNSTDIKDSGNLAEDANVLIGLFNPAKSLGLKKHFGVELKDVPDYLSWHLVEAREAECPQQLPLRFNGSNIHFKHL